MSGAQVGPLTIVGTVQVYGAGQRTSRAWFMVLDHFDGGTLGRLMASHAGPMPVDLIVRIVSEIASGLQAARDHDIVHRELTPERVGLICRDGDPHHVVLLDIGGGSPAESGSPADSVCHAYMPPEQLRGAPRGPAADVFALGVIAYRMTTGGWFPHQYGESRTGYAELSATELYHRQVGGPPIDPRERVPGLPAAWADAILAAIAADPAGRPASPRAFALALASASSPGGRAILHGPARELIELGSRYQLGDRLGGGGMAEVFAAMMIGAEGFARRVAIKRVLPELSRIPAFAAMFVAEAQIASRLAHPNIVSVLDFARDAEDCLYLVMEYVDGVDLASVLAAGAVPPSLAVFVMIEMLRGLGYAHDLPELGVIHRDVSPQNVLVSHEGEVKLSDFGLAKVRAASGRVRSDVVRGKPSYMSPEQISGDPLDGRADLFAAGVMLWEMLADRPLFTGTAREITAQVMFKDIARPSSFRAGVPADLEAVAMTLLAHQRDRRYPTARAAIDALLGCADVPRDGRGELAQLLAERFPTGPGAQAPRGRRGAGEPRAVRDGPITMAAPDSAVSSSAGLAVPGAGTPRRGVFAATLGMFALGILAAALVLARGEIAQSRTTDRSAPPAAAEAPAVPAARVVGRTGELAIIVRPWAMIWLDGVPSGQTPFRSAVPAGRYRVRLANDGAGRDEVTIVVVEPDRTATVERTW